MKATALLDLSVTIDTPGLFVKTKTVKYGLKLFF